MKLSKIPMGGAGGILECRIFGIYYRFQRRLSIYIYIYKLLSVLSQIPNIQRFQHSVTPPKWNLTPLTWVIYGYVKMLKWELGGKVLFTKCRRIFEREFCQVPKIILYYNSLCNLCLRTILYFVPKFICIFVFRAYNICRKRQVNQSSNS